MSQTHENLRKEPISSEIGSRPWLVSDETGAFFDAWQRGELIAQQASFWCESYGSVRMDMNESLGPIAIIVTGDMLYKSWYPEGGSAGICNLIAKLDASEEVQVIVFKTTVWGGDEGSAARVNDAILKCSKPVMMWLDYGGALSGGYLMASACKAGIWASRPNDRVGGIGSYLTYKVLNEKSEYNANYISIDVYSDLSPLKNHDSREVAKGNLKPAISTANKVTKAFHALVSANRPQIKEEVFDGATYMASEGIELGLLDGICSWEEMLEKAAELISSNNSATNFSTNMLGILRSPALAALLSAEAGTITDEQIDAVNAELSANRQHGLVIVKQSDFDALLSASNNDTQGQLTALQQSVAQRDATIASLNAQMGTLNTQIAQLKNTTPGEDTTNVIVNEEKIAQTAQLTGKEAIFSEIDQELANLKAKMPQPL